MTVRRSLPYLGLARAAMAKEERKEKDILYIKKYIESSTTDSFLFDLNREQIRIHIGQEIFPYDLELNSERYVNLNRDDLIKKLDMVCSICVV